MKLDLEGKVAVVTGASRGIGLAIARTLAAEGATVVGGARNPGSELEAVTDEEWLRSLELNFLSAVRACRAAVPSMVERGGGAIVTIASVNSYLPDPSGVDYSVAKAALVSFSKSLSLAYAKQGIRANVVSPGLTATDMWLGAGGVAEQVAAMTGGSEEDAIARAEREPPIGRFLDPDEIARVVALVASGAASGMTGAEVVVDGGVSPNA